MTGPAFPTPRTPFQVAAVENDKAADLLAAQQAEALTALQGTFMEASAEIASVKNALMAAIARMDAMAIHTAEQDREILRLGAALAALENGTTPVPPAGGRFPVYAHLPWRTRDGKTYGANDYAQQLLDRQAWATGAFLYSGGSFTWGTWCEKLLEAFPDGRDLFLSPKSNSGLEAFIARWPQAWRDRMTYAYFQEPEDNHTRTIREQLGMVDGPDAQQASTRVPVVSRMDTISPAQQIPRTEATRADYRAKVSEAASIVRPYGVRNAVEVQAWTLVGPANGGEQALLEMIPADDVDVFGWSFFRFPPGGDLSPQIRTVAAFMGKHFPGKPWGGASCGISVPTNASSAPRVARAQQAQASFDTLLASGAEHASWYDIEWPASDAHGDLGVDAQLLPELVALRGSTLSR